MTTDNTLNPTEDNPVDRHFRAVTAALKPILSDPIQEQFRQVSAAHTYSYRPFITHFRSSESMVDLMLDTIEVLGDFLPGDLLAPSPLPAPEKQGYEIIDYPFDEVTVTLADWYLEAAQASWDGVESWYVRNGGTDMKNGSLVPPDAQSAVGVDLVWSLPVTYVFDEHWEWQVRLLFHRYRHLLAGDGENAFYQRTAPSDAPALERLQTIRHRLVS